VAEWMPIESAPMDGRALLLWCPGRLPSLPGSGSVEFGYFDRDYPRNPWRVVNNGDYCYGGHGMDYHCGTDKTSEFCPPTHWMPLPEPPKEPL
jgi:hypothetical protein